LAGDPNNQALTITAVTTTPHMKVMVVTSISSVLYPPPSQQYSTNRPSSQTRKGM